MNGLNSSADDVVECPLCMEPLEVDDLNFYPCTCGYQICRFCWHRIRTDENELCPACRKEYPENPADFTPLTQEEMMAFKSQKRQRDQQRKQKITENRKHLSNVRVVQRNLVFVVGLPPRLADADILKKHEYFGKFGKIHKVVINPSTTYAGVQGPSASAYVTYVHNSDALRAIQSVNNVMFDGRLIKTSLGTTKYCSHFMKNQQCPKGDCMYLHELGDPEASFTKEEMHQGKHQEYEKRLHDALIATSGTSSASGMGTPSIGNCGNSGGVGGSTASSTISTNANGALTSHSNHCKNGDSNKLVNGNSASSSSSVASSVASSMSTSSSSSSSSSTNSGSTAATTAAAVAAGTTHQKDAWPSLSVSPVNNKEGGNNGIGHNGGGGANNTKSKKEKTKHEKSKHDRNGKNNKNKNNNNHNSNSNLTTNKENHHPHSHSNGTKDILHNNPATSTLDSANVADNKIKVEKGNKIQASSSTVVPQRNGGGSNQRNLKDRVISVDDELKLIENLEGLDSSSSNNRNVHNHHNSSDENGHCDGNAISDEQRSLSTSSSNSSDTTSTLSECTSGKSSPGGFPEHHLQHNGHATDVTGITTEIDAADKQQQQQQSKSQQQTTLLDGSNDNSSDYHNHQQSLSSNGTSPINKINSENNKLDGSSNAVIERQQKLAAAIEQISGNSNNHMMDTTAAALSKINFFDDNNSFFSSAASFQQSLLLKNKMDADMRHNQLNSAITSQLPDLLNGIDGFPNNATNSNEWGEAFKNVMMMRNNKQMEEHLQHQHIQQQQHQQQRQQQQEEFLRMQELQKPPNNLLNNIGLSQINGPHNDFPNNFHGATDLSRLSQTALIQHQQQILQQQQDRLQHPAHPSDHILGNSLFGTNNMSKFFDFHKNQQIHQQVPMKENQQFLMNGHGNSGGNNVGNGPMGLESLIENSRMKFLDQTNGLLSHRQQQLQLNKLRLQHGKFDPIMVNAAQNLLTNLNLNPNIVNQQLPHQQQSQNSQQPQQNQQQQNRIPNQFSHNSSVEDDLGFDPFIETQKALAELMEKEVVQQQNTNIANSSSSNNSATAVAATILQQQQQQQQQHQQQQQQQHQHQQLTQQQLLDNMQRARMPPPGFNHMNAFGFGVPRAQNSSKILPFMNMSGNGGSGGGGGGAVANGQQPQQPQMQMPNSWNPHMAAAMHQQQHQQHGMGGDPQMHMNPQQQQNQNGGNHNKGYSSNDWTAMDPAILSFRQFSSFPQPQQQQQPMPHHPSQQDMFMQHFSQQQQQQQQQQQTGFGSQPQQMHGGVNMPNALLNQNSPAQVNLSHSNWLSTEQSLFMNSLANSFTTNNNFDKFSIPMPPGIHPNNLNKQQKTECIN